MSMFGNLKLYWESKRHVLVDVVLLVLFDGLSYHNPELL